MKEWEADKFIDGIVESRPTDTTVEFTLKEIIRDYRRKITKINYDNLIEWSSYADRCTCGAISK